MKAERDDVKISGNSTVADWKKMKTRLTVGRPDNWKQAYDKFFRQRLETRYFKPIRVLTKDGDRVGEGLSITALQCTLIEFLASTLEGKSYKHCRPGTKTKCGEYEYSDSSKMFINFLCSATPFRNYFNSKRRADNFYKNVRCALLHEARTKDGWRILAVSSSGDPIDWDNKIVYRNNLHSAFEEFVVWYGKCLPDCDELQKAFIRKFDSLCIE